MKLKNRHLQIVIISLAVFCALFAYLLFYRPLLQELRQKYEECESIETKVKEMWDYIAAVKQEGKKQSLLTEQGGSRAVDELTALGNARRVKILSLSPGEFKREAPLSLLPIEMDTESSYEDLGGFLGALDRLQNSVVTVKSFTTAPNPKNPEKLKTKLAINMFLLADTHVK